MKPQGTSSRFGALMPHVQWSQKSGAGGGRRIRKGSAFISPHQLADANTRVQRRMEGAVCGLLFGALIGALVGVFATLGAVGSS